MESGLQTHFYLLCISMYIITHVGVVAPAHGWLITRYIVRIMHRISHTHALNIEDVALYMLHSPYILCIW